MSYCKQVYSLLKASLGALLNFILPPLCLGCHKNIAENHFFCASCWKELDFITPSFCPIMGVPLPYSIEGFISLEAFHSPPPFSRARAAVHHKDLARRLVSQFKYNDKLELSQPLANLMYKAGREFWKDCDFLVPIPLHYFRFWARHYNQAAELAKALAILSQKPILFSALKRIKNTQRQVGLNAIARKRNIQGAFCVNEKYLPQLKNAHIVLIDDVYTTGATIKAACTALKKAKVRHIDVLTFSRVIDG